VQGTFPATLGKYRLVRRLAVGGMAEVYLAKVAGPGGFEKTLVLKRVLPHLAEDEEFVAMFRSEASLAARLNHQNLVSIFDFGQEGDDWYLVMEFIDGPNLFGLMRRAESLKQPLAFNLAAKIIACAAEGLAYAHDFKDPDTGVPLDLVHRDVSADNILLGRNGEVKVVDFGIAKSTAQVHQTQVGTVKGKCSYMSPEQLHGDPLDRRADVFSLGMVLYELVTFNKPFDTSSERRIIQAILLETFAPATKHRPDVPPELMRILHRALAKERADRYPDCRELAADLEGFVVTVGEPMGVKQLSQLVARLSDPEAVPAPLPPPPPKPAPPPLPRAVGLSPAPKLAADGSDRPTQPQLDRLGPKSGNLGPVPVFVADEPGEGSISLTEPAVPPLGVVPTAPAPAVPSQTVPAGVPAVTQTEPALVRGSSPTHPIVEESRNTARTQLAAPALQSAAAPKRPPMKRVLMWILAVPLTIVLSLLTIGFFKDRGFNEDHPPPGKLLHAGPFTVHVMDELGKGRAVIFLHGDPGTSLDFAAVQHALSPKYRTVSIDRPGYGWTDRPRNEMTPRDQARMIHDALKPLLLSRPVLVGFSYGGPVISAWQQEYPDEIGALVYICAIADPIEGHPMHGAQAQLVEPWGRLIAYGLGPFVAPGAVESGYVDAFFPKPVDAELVERGKIHFSRPTTLLASAWDWKMLEAELPKLAEKYGGIDVPVEALSANQDRIAGPSHIKYLEEHVPGIHVKRIDQAGHQVMSTHTDEVVKAVQRAIDRVK
jgi:serine/threonine protein kinase/pimeloyl-ACP methyl ester carboxylesterase